MIEQCKTCANYVTIVGEEICWVDGIPFSGCSDVADEDGECVFYRSRKENDDADDTML